MLSYIANNVETLSGETEKDGLGKALYSLKKNTRYAQGASYLGVVLEQQRIFELAEPSFPIHWKFTEDYYNKLKLIMEPLEALL